MESIFVSNRFSLSSTKYLWVLTTVYSIAYVISNWYDPRLIRIFNLNSGGGIIIFPLTFLLSDLITEVYGYKSSRLSIWIGFFFNLIFIFYSLLISYLPAPNISTQAVINFNLVTALNTRIVFASSISYLIAEPLNSWMMAKLKILMNGKHMGIRFISSSLMGAGIDTILFCFLGFYGVIESNQITNFIASSWLIKICIEFFCLPLSISFAKKLKHIEGLDIYDEKTKFNIFLLDTEYIDQNNKFKN